MMGVSILLPVGNWRTLQWWLAVAATASVALDAGAVCAQPSRQLERETDKPSLLVDYSLTTWGLKDGLPSATIWAVTQDADGYLWLGTDAGLVRFDGVRFRPLAVMDSVTLPKSAVRAVCATRDGSIWFGFGETGAVGRLQREQVRLYGQGDGLGGGAVNMLFEHPNGTIWVGTDDGLYRFTDDQWNQVDASSLRSPVYSALVDDRGRFLVGTAIGAFWLDPDGTVPRLLDSVGNRARSLSQDRYGAIWASDPLTGFRKLGLSDRSEKPNLQEEGSGYRLLHDKRGDLWVGTSRQGLWRVRLGSDKKPVVQRLTPLMGFSSAWVTSLLEDREDNLWVTTYDGLNRLTPHKFVAVTDLGSVVSVDSTPDGSIWVGSTDSLIRFPTGEVDIRQEPMRLPGSLTTTYTGEGGTLWVSTDQQLFRVDAGKMSQVRLQSEATSSGIRVLTSDLRGGVWTYDANRGLARLSDGRVEQLSLGANPHDIQILAAHTDRTGRVWLTLEDGRIAVSEGGNNEAAISIFGPEDGLDVGPYRVFGEDSEGSVWLGGVKGLSRFKDNHFASIRATDGFPVKSITAILEDAAGCLWLGSDGVGIFRVHRSELERALATPTYQLHYSSFGKSDGFAGTPRWFGAQAAVRSKDGHLWFVSGRGITVIDPDAVPDEPPSPLPVRIEDVLVDGTRVDRHPRAQLRPQLSSLEIDYTILSLTEPLGIGFRYRLEGFDRNWVDAGARRQAFYTNLPPRSYRFSVAATNNDGTWTEPALWEFSIQPAFYQTRWFLVMCLVAGLMTVGSIWRVRVHQVSKQFALVLSERMRLSRDLHDTLLQGLIGASLQFDAVAQDIESPTQLSKDRFIRIRKDLEEYIREARQAIWDLRTPRLEECDLSTALQDAGKRATSQSSTSFALSVHGRQKRAAPIVEEQLFRIGQEAIVNAVRHARASQIVVDLTYARNSVRLSVLDDGIGFDPSSTLPQAVAHYGLVSMKERARSVGGELGIVRRVGGGTEIQTTIPL